MIIPCVHVVSYGFITFPIYCFDFINSRKQAVTDDRGHIRGPTEPLIVQQIIIFYFIKSQALILLLLLFLGGHHKQDVHPEQRRAALE